MKIVISKNGYFLEPLPNEWLAVIPDGDPDDDADKRIRTSPKLIELVEQQGKDYELCVVEIPDDATDWDICYNSYLNRWGDDVEDVEYVVYVVAGKIKYQFGS